MSLEIPVCDIAQILEAQTNAYLTKKTDNIEPHHIWYGTVDVK